MLDNPDFLAGLAVEGDQKAIEGTIHELAVGIGTATVDGVAASARHSELVTVGLLHVVPNSFGLSGSVRSRACTTLQFDMAGQPLTMNSMVFPPTSLITRG